MPSKNEILKLKSVVVSVFNGFSQIMLQKNQITGALFLWGIFMGSVTMGVAALTSVIIATLMARWRKYGDDDIQNGIYGFNAALTGVAAVLFFTPSLMLWLIVVLAAVLSTILTRYFVSRHLTVYTLPFVLTTWFFLLIVTQFFPENLNHLLTPTIDEAKIWPTIFKNYGQVIFQGHWVIGLLFFIAVLVHSHIAALYGLIGGVISMAVAYFIGMPVEIIAAGLCGFNGVLSAIAFAGTEVNNFIKSLSAVLLTAFISIFMLKYNLPQLTFPFVASSIIVLMMSPYFQPKTGK